MTALLITSPFLLIALALATRRILQRRRRARRSVTTLLSDPRQCLAFFGRHCTAPRPSRLVLPPASQDMPKWGRRKPANGDWEDCLTIVHNPRAKAYLEKIHTQMARDLIPLAK